MHLLNKPKAPDYIGQVAEKCIDLNQFILKMDELVQQHYTTKWACILRLNEFFCRDILNLNLNQIFQFWIEFLDA